MIYSQGDDSLADCEYLTERTFARQFELQFQHEVNTAKRLRNIPSIGKQIGPIKLRHHRKNQQKFNDDDDDSIYERDDFMETDAFGMRNITFKWLENSNEIPSDLKMHMNYDQLKEKCDRRHDQMKQIVDGLDSHDHEERSNATTHLNR